MQSTSEGGKDNGESRGRTPQHIAENRRRHRVHILVCHRHEAVAPTHLTHNHDYRVQTPTSVPTLASTPTQNWRVAVLTMSTTVRGWWFIPIFLRTLSKIGCNTILGLCISVPHNAFEYNLAAIKTEITNSGILEAYTRG